MQGSANYRFVTVRGFLAMLCLLAVEVQAQQVITTPSDIPTPSLAIEIPDPTQDSSESIPPIPVELSIADLQQMSLTNNPTLAQAAQKIAALEGKQLQVGLSPNPVFGYIGEDMGDGGTAGQQGAFALQRIVRGGKLSLNRAVVSGEIQQAHQELAIQSLRVLNDVRARGYEVLVAQRAVELNEQLVQISNAAAMAADNLYRAQEVSQVDVLQARVEANAAKLQLSIATNDRAAAWRRLVLVIGVPSLEPRRLTDDITTSTPPLTWDESIQRLLTESPELARAWFLVEQSRCALARAQAGQIPDIDLEASVRYSDANDNTIASVAVGLPLQIFDRNQGNIVTAQAGLAAAHREVERVELALQNRFTEAFRRYANARQQVEQYETDILPDAKSSLNLVQAGFQQGEFGYLELLTSQRTYTRFSLAYLEALRELRVSTVAVEGMLLSGGLDSPTQ